MSNDGHDRKGEWYLGGIRTLPRISLITVTNTAALWPPLAPMSASAAERGVVST